MYTLKEIAALRQKCAELRLEGREILEKYSDAELQKICNGIGPELFPEWARKIITVIHPVLEPAALIHDVEFSESDGSAEKFVRANDRFFSNGLCCAMAYAWYDLRRYAVCFQAYRLTVLCRHFGLFCWHLGALRNGGAAKG